MMSLLRQQSISVIKRWQHTIRGSRVLTSSAAICSGNDILSAAAAIRPLSLYSTSTLQNYIDALSLQQGQCISMIKQAHIHPQHYQRHISNSLIHNYDTNNQLRWFTSGGRHLHHGGRGRGNDRGRGHQSRNRIPMMKDCRTLDDAIEVCYNNLEILTPRNLSAFWAVVPRLLRHQERGVKLVPQLQAIFLKTADQIHSYGPKDLVTTILGFAKTIQTLQRSKRRYGSGSYEGYLHGILVRQRDEVFSFIARTAVNKLNQFDARKLKDLAYTYALLEYTPTLKDGSNLFDHIAEKSIPLLGKFEPQHISNMVWAFEKVNVSHPELFTKVGDHIVSLDHLNGFKPQELSNILIAYAKSEASHPNLFKKVADHIVTRQHLNDFIPQNLSNTVWSYAKAEVSHPDLHEKVADHIVTLEHLNDFKPQELANTIYAYAKAQVIHPDLFKKVANHIVSLDHLNDFNSQDFANIVWTYVKADVSHPDLFNKVADHILTPDNLNGYNEQALANIVYAYAKAEASHPDLFNKVADHIVSLKHLNDFKPQELSNTVWSYVKAEVSHPDLFNKVGDHIVSLDHLNNFKPQELANVLYAYAKAGVSHPCLFKKVADHIVALDNLNGYNEQVISNTVWAYWKAGVIRQDLNDKFIGAAVARKEEFGTKRLAILNQWMSEESKNLEVVVQDEDENGSVAMVEDDNNENNIEDDGEIDIKEETASISEDLSLLTVVQLKDRLRNLGLRVSGRKHELISRLNDYFTVLGGDK